jgi:hypothetical protein
MRILPGWLPVHEYVYCVPHCAEPQWQAPPICLLQPQSPRFRCGAQSWWTRRVRNDARVIRKLAYSPKPARAGFQGRRAA